MARYLFTQFKLVFRGTKTSSIEEQSRKSKMWEWEWAGEKTRFYP